MTRSVFGLASLGVAVLAVCASAQAPDLSKLDIVQRSVPDGPVAMVDGRPIPKERFLTMYQDQVVLFSQVQGGRAVPDSERVKAGLRTLSELIRWEILHSEGLRRGIKVSDAEVDQAYKEEMEELQAAVKDQGGAVPTEEEILSRSGQTREKAREELRGALLVKKTHEAVAKDKNVTVPDAEIRKFYDERPELFKGVGKMHLKQIYVRPKPSPEEAGPDAWALAQKSMDKALARIRAGESFEAVARDISESPDAADGGDMGMMAAAAIPPFFVEAAARLKPGAMSEAFRSEHGLHLIRLEGSEDAREVSFNDAKTKIRALLLQEKASEAMETFCQPIFEDTNRVRIYLQLEKVLAATGRTGELGAAQ